MKTTHQLAQELLALPNVPICVEGWCDMMGYELTAVMTGYNPSGEAILIQKCVDPTVEAEMREWLSEHTTMVRHPINFTRRLKELNSDNA